MSGLAVTEAELHAHIDGLLPEARRAEVEEYLATHLEDAQRVRAWREQNADLRAWFDPVLAESAPARLRRAASGRRKLPLRYAAVLGWIALGGIAGWFLHDYRIGRCIRAVDDKHHLFPAVRIAHHQTVVCGIVHKLKIPGIERCAGRNQCPDCNLRRRVALASILAPFLEQHLDRAQAQHVDVGIEGGKVRGIDDDIVNARRNQLVRMRTSHRLRFRTVAKRRAPG